VTRLPYLIKDFDHEMFALAVIPANAERIRGGIYSSSVLS